MEQMTQSDISGHTLDCLQTAELSTRCSFHQFFLYTSLKMTALRGLSLFFPPFLQFALSGLVNKHGFTSEQCRMFKLNPNTDGSFKVGSLLFRPQSHASISQPPSSLACSIKVPFVIVKQRQRIWSWWWIHLICLTLHPEASPAVLSVSFLVWKQPEMGSLVTDPLC